MSDHEILMWLAIGVMCVLALGLALAIMIDSIHQTRRGALEMNRTRPARLTPANTNRRRAMFSTYGEFEND